jgi:hypothetical protein
LGTVQIKVDTEGIVTVQFDDESHAGVDAWATPDSTVTKRSVGRTSAARMRTVFRAI